MKIIKTDPPFKFSAWALAVFAAFFIAAAGCASFQAPQTNAQRLAYVDSQFAATVNAATDLYKQGVITEAQADSLTPIIDRGDQAIDAGWAALAQDRPSDVLGYIRVANEAMLEISRRMEASHE